MLSTIALSATLFAVLATVTDAFIAMPQLHGDQGHTVCNPTTQKRFHELADAAQAHNMTALAALLSDDFVADFTWSDDYDSRNMNKTSFVAFLTKTFNEQGLGMLIEVGSWGSAAQAGGEVGPTAMFTYQWANFNKKTAPKPDDKHPFNFGEIHVMAQFTPDASKFRSWVQMMPQQNQQKNASVMVGVFDHFVAGIKAMNISAVGDTLAPASAFISQMAQCGETPSVHLKAGFLKEIAQGFDHRISFDLVFTTFFVSGRALGVTYINGQERSVPGNATALPEQWVANGALVIRIDETAKITDFFSVQNARYTTK